MVEPLKKNHSLQNNSSCSHTLVLGLGNTILTDDGVGIYIAREIKKKIKYSGVTIQEASLGGLELLDAMVDFKRVILIDAMVIGSGEIGSCIKLSPNDLGGGSAMARHQVPLHEALELGRRLHMNLPKDIIIYGIMVKDTTTFCESCTPEVQACIPKIVDEIIQNEFVVNVI